MSGNSLPLGVDEAKRLATLVGAEFSEDWQKLLSQPDPPTLRLLIGKANQSPVEYSVLMRCWSRIDEFESTLQLTGAVHGLLDILSQHSTDVNIATNCCVSLGLLATKTPVRNFLAGTDVVICLLGVLEHHMKDVALTTHICNALTNILYQTDSAKILFVKEGGLAKLCNVFSTHVHKEKPLVAASKVLRDLCNLEHKELLVASWENGDIVTSLLDFLCKCQTLPSAQQHLFWALSNLIQGQRELKLQFVHKNSFKLIKRAMESNLFEERLHESASYVLHRLFTEEELVRAGQEVGIRNALFDSLQTFENDINTTKATLKAITRFLSAGLSTSTEAPTAKEVSQIISAAQKFIYSNPEVLLFPLKFIRKMIAAELDGLLQSARASQFLSLILSSCSKFSKICDLAQECLDDLNYDTTLSSTEEQRGSFDDDEFDTGNIEFSLTALRAGLFETSDLSGSAIILPSKERGLEDEVAKLQAQLDKARAEIQAKDKQIAIYKEKELTYLNAIESLSSSQHNLSASLEAREEEVAFLTTKTKSQEERIDNLQQQCQAFKSTKAEDDSRYNDCEDHLWHFMVLALKFAHLPWSDRWNKVATLREKAREENIPYLNWPTYIIDQVDMMPDSAVFERTGGTSSNRSSVAISNNNRKKPMTMSSTPTTTSTTPTSTTLATSTTRATTTSTTNATLTASSSSPSKTRVPPAKSRNDK